MQCSQLHEIAYQLMPFAHFVSVTFWIHSKGPSKNKKLPIQTGFPCLKLRSHFQGTIQSRFQTKYVLFDLKPFNFYRTSTKRANIIQYSLVDFRSKLKSKQDISQAIVIIFLYGKIILYDILFLSKNRSEIDQGNLNCWSLWSVILGKNWHFSDQT